MLKEQNKIIQNNKIKCTANNLMTYIVYYPHFVNA